mmetsp:Transcript_44285/g.51002  ORF Transcript_44285/g.51002 Transcript_44285/m.51002 type:complete len:139 (-) Transcript_44285:577-993(-)
MMDYDYKEMPKREMLEQQFSKESEIFEGMQKDDLEREASYLFKPQTTLIKSLVLKQQVDSEELRDMYTVYQRSCLRLSSDILLWIHRDGKLLAITWLGQIMRELRLLARTLVRLSPLISSRRLGLSMMSMVILILSRL